MHNAKIIKNKRIGGKVRGGQGKVWVLEKFADAERQLGANQVIADMAAKK